MFWIIGIKCVFKPKGYNIVNAPCSERKGCLGMVSAVRQVDPTLLSSPPPPLSQTPSSPLGRHTRRFPTHPPGVLVRVIGATSQMGPAVWMPWPSSPTLGKPLSPYYLFIPIPRFQFRWRLMVARVVFMKAPKSTQRCPGQRSALRNDCAESRKYIMRMNKWPGAVSYLGKGNSGGSAATHRPRTVIKSDK